MADLVIDPTNVGINLATSTYERGKAGQAVVHAQPVYRSTDGTWLPLDATMQIQVGATIGIALTPNSTGFYFLIGIGGEFNVGANVTVGLPYVVSATGGIAPETDLVATNYVYRIGTGAALQTIDCTMDNTGIAKT